MMIFKKSRGLFILLALASSGCADAPIINIVDNRPKAPEFDERPRPALTAAITGTVMAQPSRIDIGDSWIKRHIYTEGAPSEVGLSYGQQSLTYGQAPTSAAPQTPPPKTVLSPTDFNPEHLM